MIQFSKPHARRGTLLLEYQTMKLHIITIVLDGMPCITWHLPVFNQLSLDWHWTIVHGTADNVKDTSWCAKITPRLSVDGTTEYLATLKGHPRITVLEQELWPGKTAMCNAAIRDISDPCWLLQCDSDELWTAAQLNLLVEMFNNRPLGQSRNCARFFCRYFVGQNIVTCGEDSYGNNRTEWLRFWKFYPKLKFLSHEPPALEGVNDYGPMGPYGQSMVSNEKGLSRYDSRSLSLVFDHYAYAFENQVAFKETYYRYPDAVKHWKRLQAHPGPWPISRLKDFLPWVDERAMADLLHKP